MRRFAIAAIVPSGHAGLTAVGLAFVANFFSSPGQSFVLAVFVDEMLAGAGVSRTTFSALYAAGTVVSALVVITLGRYSDRFGMRAVWIVVASALAGACVVASVATGVLLVFVALSMLRAFGQGSFPLLGTLIVARSFVARRGRAMAVAMFGHVAGGIMLPPLVTLLVLGIGWRHAYQIIAAAIIVVALPLVVFVPRTGRTPTVADERSATALAEPLRHSRLLREIELPTRDVALLLAVFAAQGLILTALIFHATSLLERNGLDATEAALALTIMAAAGAAGIVGGGFAADKAATRSLLALMTTLLTGGVVLLLIPTAAAAYLSFAAMGVAGGMFVLANSTVWARTYGTEQLGRMQGLGFGAMIGGAAVGPVLLASSHSATGSYVPGIIGLAGLAGASFLAGIGRREPQPVPPAV